MQSHRIMKTSTPAKATPSMNTNGRTSRVEVAAIAGAVAGAATGAFLGPIGIVVGAVAGTAAGTIIGVALADDSDRRHAHDAELDRDLGVR